MFRNCRRFFSHSSLCHLGASGRDPFVPVYEDNPITMAVDLFANGLHRAPVFDLSKRVVSTVSQSSVIQLLSQNIHMGKLKEIGQQKISQFGLGLAAPVVVKKVSHLHFRNACHRFSF